ncbi:MAG: hypothetical protein IJX75_01250 [Clostridia bacterium]|nr:hypothetical protein [Clostridia bacterium]
MRNAGKKALSIIAAATMLTAAFSFVGCNDTAYKGDALDGYQGGEVTSQGGFVVEQGDYVYFINGAEDYSANNTYGEVVKGALMRISKSDLTAGNYDNVKTVVPSLLVSQNFESGIYIDGDSVYYATPTTDKNLKGEEMKSWIDFKSAKLDGSAAPKKDPYFRLSSNSANYRFVKENDTVYCLYEEDGALKSFNTDSGKSTTLVSGAKSAFFYDKQNLDNPKVYYTMSVVYDADSDNSTTAAYDQLYCVSASATVEKINESEASYTVAGGKTYDFDKSFMEKKNKEAKENKEDAPYDFGDYTTYPYVNLGNLVLDGVGKSAKPTQFNTHFTEETKSDAFAPDGYNYTISRYENGGVYFTRADLNKTESDAENAKLYYLAESSFASEWNTVTGNQSDKIDEVALDTANTGSAIMLINEGVHEYLYVANDTLYKASQPVNGKTETITLAYKVTGATLWQVRGDYLYYYASGTNGNNVSRINYKGDANAYNPHLVTDEYKPLTVAYVDWNSSWYKPEFVGDVLLYSNAQSFGTTAYNYIYAAAIGTTEEIIANNEAYEAVQEEIDSYSENTALQTAMKYYFRTGKTDAFEAVKDLYSTYQQEKFQEFVDNTELKEESAFIRQVGKTNEKDAEAIADAWVNSLLSKTEEVKDEGLPTWAIVLIVVGSVLVVAAGVTIPLVIVAKKKAAKQAEEEATVNAYKRKKIDTTDDKTIDVYADEQAEQPVEETTAETPVEETQETSEEVVEETTAEETAEVEPETETAEVEPEAEKEE